MSLASYPGNSTAMRPSHVPFEPQPLILRQPPPYLNTVNCPHCTLLLSFPPGTQLLICPACHRTSALTVVPRLQLRCAQCQSVLNYLAHYAVVQCPTCGCTMHTPTSLPPPSSLQPQPPPSRTPASAPPPKPLDGRPPMPMPMPMSSATTSRRHPPPSVPPVIAAVGDFSSAEHKREFTAADDAVVDGDTAAAVKLPATSSTTFGLNTATSASPSAPSSIWSSLVGGRRRSVKDNDGNQWQPLHEDSHSAYHRYDEL